MLICRRAVLVCVCTTFLRIPLCAQILPLHSYSTKDGLPSNWITALIQDSRGYLWIGTSEGLSVYDGATFVNYTTADGLSNNFIWALKESKSHPGTIWIGTNKRGLTKFADGRFTRIRVGTTLNTNTISSIEEDANGVLWCGTSGGVFLVEGDSARAMFSDGLFAQEFVLTASTDSLLWLGSGQSLAVYTRNGRHITSLHLPVGPNKHIEWMRADREGNLWTGDNTGLVMVFRDTTLLHTRQFNSPMTGMQLDHQGFVWLVTPEGVLKVRKSEFQNGEAISYGPENGFPEPGWPFEDREGDLWFRTFTSGLLKLSDMTLQRFPIQALEAYAVLDSREHVWLPGSGGLWEVWQQDDDRWSSVYHRTPDIAKSDAGGPLGLDAQKRLWAASGNGSLRCYAVSYKSGGQSQLRLEKVLGVHQGIPSDIPSRILIDRQNRLWYSLFSKTGVVDLNSPSHRISLLDFSRDLSIRAIFQDHHGDIWLGDFDKGLFLFRGSDCSKPPERHYTMEDGLPDDGIRSFGEDDEGRLWVGTRYGGVGIYNGQTFQTLSIKDGLISNSIWAIAKDGAGRMWLGTGSGLMFVNSKETHELGWSNELIGEPVDFCAATHQDLIWFGRVNAHLSAYETRKYAPNLIPPPVYITSVAINDSAMPLQIQLALPFDRNNCFIQYIGISLKDERNVQYQYRLNNLNWGKPTKQRSVSYAALSPGEYRFEVHAINSDGIVSEQPAVLSFTIFPPFWQRWWFLALCILTALSGVALLYRYRTDQLLKVERLRMRIASDLHDDVGTNLSSIVVTSQIMERQASLSDQDRLQLKVIESIAAGTQEMMRDIVWMLNPKNDSLDDLVLKMKEVAARLLQNVHYRFLAPQEKLLEKVSIEFKRNVFLIFKESLNNIVKHSSAAEVVIEIRQADDRFVLQIRDDGRGFEPDHKGTGTGITSLQRRAAQIGGTMEFVSAEGEGTIVTLSVKNHANA